MPAKIKKYINRQISSIYLDYTKGFSPKFNQRNNPKKQKTVEPLGLRVQRLFCTLGNYACHIYGKH